MEIIEPVKECDRSQVELLERDVNILLSEVSELRQWKETALAEIENLKQLAEDNRDDYIDAATKLKRSSKRDYEREHKAAARGSESQYWVNRLEGVLLKIK